LKQGPLAKEVIKRAEESGKSNTGAITKSSVKGSSFLQGQQWHKEGQGIKKGNVKSM
jgi:hypothetical protein